MQLIDPVSFADHLKAWKPEVNLDFLPKVRREYQDPTLKYKHSIPKVPDVYNKGHNIWYIFMTPGWPSLQDAAEVEESRYSLSYRSSRNTYRSSIRATMTGRHWKSQIR